ncbi:MAG: bacillithiol system redox-active protein YtxJ [Calditrichia bacterium]|nr:bacillithiol system redox-active protein YtxJ [Calditrichia bacterium]
MGIRKFLRLEWFSEHQSGSLNRSEDVMIKECATIENFEQLLSDSKSRPVFLLKHSTSCGISSGAKRRYETFSNGEENADFWLISVIPQRALSQHIAQFTGITHQSPQALLFIDGKVVWQESHWSIDEKNLAGALEKHISL